MSNTMTKPAAAEDFSETITVAAAPDAVYAAINDVGRWWSGTIEGETHAVGDNFTYRYKDMHQSLQEVTELVPGQRVAWHVLDSNISFLKHKSEWTGTTISFDIVPTGDGSEIHFVHHGLSEASECFHACSSGWHGLITGNLKTWIESRKSSPAPF